MKLLEGEIKKKVILCLFPAAMSHTEMGNYPKSSQMPLISRLGGAQIPAGILALISARENPDRRIDPKLGLFGILEKLPKNLQRL